MFIGTAQVFLKHTWLPGFLLVWQPWQEGGLSISEFQGYSWLVVKWDDVMIFTQDALVILIVTLVTLFTDLATAVAVGMASWLQFAVDGALEYLNRSLGQHHFSSLFNNKVAGYPKWWAFEKVTKRLSIWPFFGILNVSGVETRELLDSCLTLGGDFCMFDHENTFLILMFTQHLN